tara:strand:+ start:31575 stop:32123 length:549 start_codon:yes stop_codon:yes gene_type:complete
MILGLDISTSCTGWCVLSECGDLVSMGYIDLKSKKCLFDKSVIVKRELSSINLKNEIMHIFIEENLQSFRSGFSSAQTLSTLARFNGIVSYLCFDEFGFKPLFLNVNSSRKALGIKIEREKKCGITTKQQVFDWVSKDVVSTHLWPKKILKSGPRKGLTVLEPGCYDMADAYVIASAGLMNI